MATISLPTATHDRLRLVAAAWECTEGEAITKLLDRLATNGTPSDLSRDHQTANTAPIHAVYQGTRVEGSFDSQTGSVTIASGDLAGTTFKSPSRAAIEVVRWLNPEVSPNRNGWGFWTVTSTGQPLQTLRSQGRD